MDALPTWEAVAEKARDLGYGDFAGQLLALDNGSLDEAWDQGSEHIDAPTVQRFEKTSDHRLPKLLTQTLDEWRTERTPLMSAAIVLRLALGSRQRWDQRPVFEPGNALAVTSGAHSPAILTREIPLEAERLRAALLADLPEDAPRASELLVEDLARLRVQIRLLSDYLDRVGPLDARGKPRQALKELSWHISHEIKLASALGMTPRAQAAIMADRAAGAKDAIQARRSAMDAEEELRRRYG